MATERVRVKTIILNGLFRQYDHVIPLRGDERITILHGQNGVGKTVTLRLVAALLEGRYDELGEYPFALLRVEFTDGSFIEALPAGEAKREAEVQGAKARAGNRSVIQIRYGDAGGQPEAFELETLRSRLERQLRSEVELTEIVQSIFGLSTNEPGTEKVKGTALSQVEEPENLCKLRQRVAVHFIEAQRLLDLTNLSRHSHRDSASPVRSAVHTMAEDMAARIKQVDSEYRETSTRLDSSLPSRLFSKPSGKETMTGDELRGRVEALEKERRRLQEIGLVPEPVASFSANDLDDTQRSMFMVYLADNEEKLGVFRELADRAEILLSILNHKFAPKRITLDKDAGYKVLSHDGRPLDPDKLSSGEQHELVLLHSLLFKVAAGTLLLIDEPELSLHVTWQNDFLEDLMRIARKVEIDVLVATHSPYIVGQRHELMVQLGEPV